ncbi:MAG: prepilin-type N-terminal cleavage/methylation domain-containing protein [Planctomycetota bacterium]|nr:prepilin-type N-terminal cleavage/methylation domain-containing protein [Planctomycetota bacterium]
MKTSRNFTLIELLVAIGLLMVIVWLVTMAFNNTSKVSQDVTASLDYHAKGRAILDALANDIVNTVQVYKQDDTGTTTFGAVVHLARMNTRYDDGADWGSRHKSASDVVAVRWQFDAGNHTLNRKLYGLPDDVANYDAARLTAIENYADGGNAIADANRLTYPDIRGFSIVPSTTTYKTVTGEGTIPEYYTVSFWLTNAPNDGTVPDTPADGDDARREPYTWIYFTRQISTR